MKSLDLPTYFGMRFGERTVLNQWKSGYGGNRFLLCRCDSGHEAWVKIAHLNSGNGGICKTCHCQKIATRHGQARTDAETPTYKKWVNMRRRVSTDPSYVRRGIKVCKRWDVFENFLADMGEPPHPKMEIDRKDGTKNYNLENCEWKTRVQNNKNRQNLRMLEFSGMNMCISDWEKYLNLPPDKLRKKLRADRPIEIIMRECGFGT